MATDTAAFTTLRVIPVIEGVGASLDKQLGSPWDGKKARRQLGDGLAGGVESRWPSSAWRAPPEGVESQR